MNVWDYLVWFFWLYVFFVFIALVIRVIVAVFRDTELSGGAKALWWLFVLVLPLIGSIVYIIVSGHRAKKETLTSHEAYLRESEQIAAAEKA